MRKLTKILLSAVLFFGIGTAFADEVPAPTFDPVDGSVVEANSKVSINGPEQDGYAVLYVVNDPTFDFSQYDNYYDAPDGKIYQYPITITQNTTITAITVEYDYMGDITGWSEKVSASYTVKASEPEPVIPSDVPAPVFKVDGNTVENATMAVPEGTKVILTNGTESDETPLLIYYNRKNDASDFATINTQARLTSALQSGVFQKLWTNPAEGIEITQATLIHAGTARADAEGNVTWSTIITKNFTIASENPNPGNEKPAAPTFNPDGGEVYAQQEITLSTTTTGAKIYYANNPNFSQYTTQDELDEAANNDIGYGDNPVLYESYDKPTADLWGDKEGSTVSISAAAVMVSADGKLTWSDATTKQFTIKEEELPEGAVAKPVIDPGNDATVRMGDMVTIECATEGAEIYYTTDGSKVYTTDEKGNNITGINESAIRYTEPFVLNESMFFDNNGVYELKISAIATKDGRFSTGVSAGYIVYPNKPTFSPAAGAVPAGTKVTIECVPTISDIYYTTDGSTPTMEESPKYTGPIEITEAMTIKAIAVLVQYQESASASYTISGSTPVEPDPEAWFTLSPVAGSTVNVGDEITITSDVDPDDIMYQWFTTKAEAESAEYSFSGWISLGDKGNPVVEAGKPFLAVTVAPNFIETAGKRVVVEYTINGFTPVVPDPTRPDAPEISPVAGAYFAGTCITVSSPSWWEGTDTVYYRLGTKNGAYTTAVPDTTEDGEYIGDRVSFALTADTTVWMFLVDKNGVHSDTVDARYTLKAAPSFDGSVEVLSPTAKANSGFNAPDSVYTATPVFQAKVEGLALTFNKILLRYRCYQNAGNTLVAEAFSSDEEFSLTAKNGGKLANGTYMVVVDVVEKGEDDMDGNPIFVAYTKNGAAVEAVRYITIAAPAWTLVSPELNTEPYLLRNGKDMEVVIAAENCNGLFGRGGSKMQVVKRIYANSLFKSPADAVDGLLGKAIYYEMVDNTEVNGEIRFTLPEGWADSVRKVLTAAVQEAYVEWDVEAAKWEDEFYAMYGLKDENDLSDCLVEIMPFETVKYGSDSYFMLAEEYEYMSVSVPFTVVDTIFAPTFSLDGGVVEKGYELMITADMASDTIYYRENEGAFKKAGSEVKVTIESDMTVAAYAVSKEGKKSDTVEARFIIAPSMDVKPAGNFKMVGDTALLFTDSIPLFDILLGETDYQEFGIVAQLYTEEAFGNYNAPMKELSLEAKDSVRVNFDTVLVGGEYVATFALQATRGSEEGFVEIHFRAGKEAEEPIGPTAVEAGELAGVRVYPNPNAGTFSVDVPERARVEIFGLNGALLMSREVNAGVAAFNLDHSGIYFVRVMANNKTAVKRVVVR